MPVEQYRSVLNYDKDKNQIRTKPDRKNARRQLKNCDRTAYLIAKHEGGDFLLRIEDTDQERFVEGATEIIYRTLEETGLVHDEGPG